MTAVCLVPLVSTPGTLLAWVGVRNADRDQSPQVRFEINHTAVVPASWPRPLARIALSDTDGGVWLGVAQFVVGDAPVDVRCFTSNGSDAFSVRPLPLALSADGAFHVVLASCFRWFNSNQAGLETVVRAARDLCKSASRGPYPDLTLLLGDQVYLDLPTLTNYGSTTESLFESFRVSPTAPIEPIRDRPNGARR